MNNNRYARMSVEELIEVYAGIGVQQADAIDDYNNARYNRLFKHVRSIEGELRSRPGDARRALMRLYDHENPQTRLNAAKATLAVAPIEARRKLEEIYATRLAPQGPDAGMCLSNLDRGIFKPT